VAAGADVEEPRGETRSMPLHWAAVHGHLEVILAPPHELCVEKWVEKTTTQKLVKLQWCVPLLPCSIHVKQQARQACTGNASGRGTHRVAVHPSRGLPTIAFGISAGRSSPPRSTYPPRHLPHPSRVVYVQSNGELQHSSPLRGVACTGLTTRTPRGCAPRREAAAVRMLYGPAAPPLVRRTLRPSGKNRSNAAKTL
jgi:hypothetical protein